MPIQCYLKSIFVALFITQIYSYGKFLAFSNIGRHNTSKNITKILFSVASFVMCKMRYEKLYL